MFAPSSASASASVSSVPSSSSLSSSPFRLTHVLGHSISSVAQYSLHPQTSDIVYLSGSLAIVYNPRLNTQSRILFGRHGRPLSCVCFSPSGEFLAVGESGKNSAILIFKFDSGERIGTVSGAHRCGPVDQLHWAPNGNFLVSLGSADNENEGQCLKFWPFPLRSSTIRSLNSSAAVRSRVYHPAMVERLPANVHCFALSPDSLSLVTAGPQNLSLWRIDERKFCDPDSVTPTAAESSGALTREELKLGVHRDSEFVSVQFGCGSVSTHIFALTKAGVLTAFTQKEKKKAMAAGNFDSARRYPFEIEKWVDLRLERGYSLSLAMAPGGSGIIAIAGAEGKTRLFEPENLSHVATLPRPAPLLHSAAHYPHVLGAQLFSDLSKCVCAFSDRSFIVFDIRSPKERPISVFRSFQAHSDWISDISLIEFPPSSQPPPGSPMPIAGFITASNDDSIRIWFDPDKPPAALPNDKSKPRFSDQIASSLSLSGAGPRAALFIPPNPAIAGQTSGLLVSGDRIGNIRVFSLSQSPPLEVSFLESHNKPVSALDFSSSSALLASSSRDSLVHFYNLSNPAQPSINTLPPAHSAAILNCKFAQAGKKFCSLSADQSIVIREVGPEGAIERAIRIPVKAGTPKDFALHPTGKYLAVVSSDRSLRLFDCNSGKETRRYAVPGLGQSEPVKLTIDPSGLLLAVSFSDKFVRLIDWYSGSLVHSLETNGHLVTALRFSRDCERIVAGSADGAVLIYKLAPNWTAAMKQKLAENEPNTPRKTSRALDYLADIEGEEEEKPKETKQTGNQTQQTAANDSRWAARIGTGYRLASDISAAGVTVKVDARCKAADSASDGEEDGVIVGDKENEENEEIKAKEPDTTASAAQESEEDGDGEVEEAESATSDRRFDGSEDDSPAPIAAAGDPALMRTSISSAFFAKLKAQAFSQQNIEEVDAAPEDVERRPAEAETDEAASPSTTSTQPLKPTETEKVPLSPSPSASAQFAFADRTEPVASQTQMQTHEDAQTSTMTQSQNSPSLASPDPNTLDSTAALLAASDLQSASQSATLLEAKVARFSSAFNETLAILDEIAQLKASSGAAISQFDPDSSLLLLHQRLEVVLGPRLPASQRLVQAQVQTALDQYSQLLIDIVKKNLIQ